MKIRRSILLFCAVVAVLIAFVIWFRNKDRPQTPFIILTETNVAQLATPRSNAPVQTNMPVAKTANGAFPSKSPSPNKAERAMDLLSTYNDVPIEFFGKAEDQFGNAVANATINFGVRVYNGFESTVKRGQVTSEAHGLFTISGYKGQELGIGVVKAGYTFISMNGSGIYSRAYPEEQRAHPDAKNPVVIKMWKLQGAEPLAGISKEYRLPFTNAPLFFDLITGSVSNSGGDIEIITTRSTGSLSKRNPNDWSLQFKPVNGGILESDFATSRITYEAPEAGYENHFLVQMNRDDRAWHDNVDKVFFLKSRNGQVYSKLHFEFRINNEANDPMWFQFRGVANTNASRNWEATVGQ